MTNPTVCHPQADWSCYGTDDEVRAIDPDLKEYAESLAWITFATLTGYRVALCPIQLRPCAEGCNVGSYLASTVLGLGEGWIAPGAGVFFPVLSGGRWFNMTCGCVGGGCGCTTTPTISLPAGVGRVESVSIDGAVLPADAYRVDWGSKLVRLDGEAWPMCQDMTAAPDADGSFVVTYWPGQRPTSVDARAVGNLAVEFLKSCSGDGKCRLPKSVTNVVRNGVTYAIKTDMFNDGLTGLQDVDILIRQYNPNLLKRRPILVSSDRRRGRVPTS